MRKYNTDYLDLAFLALLLLYIIMGLIITKKILSSKEQVGPRVSIW